MLGKFAYRYKQFAERTEALVLLYEKYVQEISFFVPTTNSFCSATITDWWILPNYNA